MRNKNLENELKLKSLLTEAHQALHAGAIEIAKKKYKQCLKIAPKNPHVNSGMAQALDALQFNERAGQYYFKSTIYSDEAPEFTFHYACWLFKGKKYTEALPWFKKLIDRYENIGIAPPNADLIYKSSLMNLGAILRSMGRSADAISVYKKMISIFGSHPDILFNLGNAYETEGRYNEAIECLEGALAHNPADVEVRVNLAYIKNIIGELDDAERILALYNENENGTHVSEVKFGLALTKLKKKNFEDGWTLYNHRWIDENFLGRQQKIHSNLRDKYRLDYKIADLKKKNILVVAEQGTGDVIMFSRYLNSLIEIANSVTMLIDQRQKTFFSNSFPSVNFINIDDEFSAKLNNYDIYIPVGSLPSIFYTLEKTKQKNRYLYPTPNAVNKFKSFFPEGNKKYVGLSWQGGGYSTGMKQRSIDLTKLQKILDLENFQFVSLQYGEAARDVQKLSDPLKGKITQFSQETISDFDDLAGIIENLDLVISVQNTVVHLSGSMGKKCYVAIPVFPEWRYGLTGSTMEGYGSVELIRQKEKDNWEEVINYIHDELLKFGANNE